MEQLAQGEQPGPAVTLARELAGRAPALKAMNGLSGCDRGGLKVEKGVYVMTPECDELVLPNRQAAARTFTMGSRRARARQEVVSESGTGIATGRRYVRVPKE